MAAATDDAWQKANSIYDFQAKDIDGNNVDLSKYKLVLLLFWLLSKLNRALRPVQV
jgi:hypothetical protein